MERNLQKKFYLSGFVELTPENAKFYGDSFMLEENMDKKFQAKYQQGVTVPVPQKRDLVTGISGETYIKWMTDNDRQDYRGIDFDDGEIEEEYGEIIKTPLMRKDELQKSIQEIKARRDLIIETNERREENFSQDR